MKTRRETFRHFWAAALLLAALFAAGCSGPGRQDAAAKSPGTDARATGGKATIRYAKGLVIEYHDGYKVLRVLSPWRDARTQFTFVLAPRGAKVPPLTGNEIVVRTPVRRFVVTSTVYVPQVAMLGLEDTLVAVAHGQMISTPSVAKRFADGKISEISNGSRGMMATLNMERLLSLSPDLVMLYGTGNPAYDFHEQLHAAGIPFAINGEYMESSPLGEAEWIKFVAAFFDKDAEAERLFAGIASRYEAEAARAKSAATRPTVFSAVDYPGVWYMPGGKSYRARFFQDAGARYLWDDDQTEGSMPLTMEAVIARAKDADFWVDPGSVRSLAQLAGLDDRYRTLRAFKTGQVYNNDVRMNPGGGNDFWEGGMSNPDVVLADLVSIFHPELKPGYTKVYYRKLPERTAP